MKTNETYRGVAYKIEWNSEAFAFILSFNGNEFKLDAESDDNAISIAKTMINQHLNALNPKLQSFIDSL